MQLITIRNLHIAYKLNSANKLMNQKPVNAIVSEVKGDYMKIKRLSKHDEEEGSIC